MLATFEGRIEKGQLLIDELDHSMRILEGKRLAIISLEVNEKNELAAGQLKAAVYTKGHLDVVGGGDVSRFEGKQVFVIVRHELFIRHQAFDEKYQLGSKVGDVDK